MTQPHEDSSPNLNNSGNMPPPIVSDDATNQSVTEIDVREAVAVKPVPEAVPAPAPAPTAPTVMRGRPIDVDPTAAAPNEIVQLLVLDSQFPPGSVLRGLILGAGLEARTVLVGRMRFPGPDGATWDACYGKTVPPGAFVILLAENVTDETIIARATWYIEAGDGAPALPSPAAVPVQAPQLQPATVGLPQATPYAQAQAQAPFTQALAHAPHVPFAHAPAVHSGPTSVTPGTNEVVVLLQRAECEKLLRSLTGNEPREVVPHQDQPSIVRQLLAALSR